MKKWLIFCVFLHTFFSCGSSSERKLETLTPPLIIIETDSAVVIEDAKGEQYTLNTIDRIDYSVYNLKIGDTLK